MIKRLWHSEAPCTEDAQTQWTLQVLHRAYTNAQAAKRSSREFAMSLVELLAVGVDPTNLRRLVVEGLVEHGVDRTTYNAKHRTLRRVPHLCFTEGSNFVLSERGAALASAMFKRRASPISARNHHAFVQSQFHSRSMSMPMRDTGENRSSPVLILTGRTCRRRHIIELGGKECRLPAGQFYALCKLSGACLGPERDPVELPRATVSRLRHALKKAAREAGIRDEVIGIVGKNKYALRLGPEQIAVHAEFCRFLPLDRIDSAIIKRLKKALYES
jgi:hypothetical protein